MMQTMENGTVCESERTVQKKALYAHRISVPEPAARYARQTILPQIGVAGQRKLEAASVLILGLGGLGCPAALYLTAAGVGTIGLADSDTVGLSNLQRQVLYSQDQIGVRKTEAALQRLQALSPHTRFVCYPEGINPANASDIVSDYDLVLDCCDNFPTRFLLDDVCAACEKPWVHGSIGAFHGQITVFDPRNGNRYEDLYPDRETLCNRADAAGGVLGTVPGVIGTLQANEAIKLLAGFGEPLIGRLLLIDLCTLQTQIINY